MRAIKCRNCLSIFPETEITIPGHCPYCTGATIPMLCEVFDDRTAKDWDKTELDTLWCIFGDIPMDPETEQIEDSFIGFPAGTHREEIWHWFDERYSGGVHALMYEVG